MAHVQASLSKYNISRKHLFRPRRKQINMRNWVRFIISVQRLKLIDSDVVHSDDAF